MLAHAKPFGGKAYPASAAKAVFDQIESYFRTQSVTPGLGPGVQKPADSRRELPADQAILIEVMNTVMRP